MSKSAEAFRTISEVAEVLDTPAHVLRFWESRFSQIKPVKRAGGRRYYRPVDVALLGGIKRLLHDDGLTIRGVQKILREHGMRHVAGFAGQDFEGDGNAPAEAPRPAPTIADPSPAMAEPTVVVPWPHAPTPDAASADDRFVPDPMDNPTGGPTGFGDTLFDRAEFDRTESNRAGSNRAESNRTESAAPTKAASSPFSSLAATSPGADARAELQRDRDAAGQLQNPLERGTHHDLPAAEDTTLPAAALLRAMTTYRASQRRAELRAVYQRLTELHHRRLGLGHSATD